MRLSAEESLANWSMATPFRRFRSCIQSELLVRNIDKEQRWVSLSWCKSLLNRDDLDLKAALKEIKKRHIEWTNDISELEPFVLEFAPRLFAMLVHTRTEQLLDQFCTKGIGDAMFPITCNNMSETRVVIDGEPPMELALGETDLYDLQNMLDLWQKRFFIPELCWANFEHPPIATSLPFLGERKEIHRTSFSIVYKCLVHRDHIAFDSSGLVRAQTSASTCCLLKHLTHTLQQSRLCGVANTLKLGYCN